MLLGKKLLQVVLFGVCAALLLTGCEPLHKPLSFTEAGKLEVRKVSKKLNPGQQYLPDWEAMEPAVARSLEFLSSKDPGQRAIEHPDADLTWGDLARSLREFRKIAPRLEEDPDLLGKRFVWLNLQPDLLLTGYYEPLVPASLTRTPEYRYPLYGCPDDLQKADLGKFHPRWEGQSLLYRITDGRIQPYFDRQEIDSEQALSGRGLEIAWAMNPADVFFLQIQGSGRLLLPDGSIKHVLYSGKNGHQYVSLGRVLIERGHLSKDEVSMQSIRRFLSENREIAADLLETNPSYVFFRLEDSGPYGSMNKILTPFISVASDHTLFPPGSLAVVDTTLPSPLLPEGRPWRGVVLPQDAGGAIKGGRMDLFCGFGENAEYIAGHLNSRAEAYLLVSKEVVKNR
ncbi:MAG: murein transglycosylase A [Desulfovibrionales bacterium]